jgi:hypothetical protein
MTRVKNDFQADRLHEKQTVGQAKNGVRVARFFLEQHTKKRKYTKRPQNIGP